MAKRLKRYQLPMIPVRGLVIFPYMVLHFDVARKPSIRALEHAMAENQMIFLAAQKDEKVEVPAQEDIYTWGTVSSIKQILKLPDNTVRVLVEGVSRGELLHLHDNDDFLTAEIIEVPEPEEEGADMEYEAAVRQLHETLEEYFRLNHKITDQTADSLLQMHDPATLTDAIAANIFVKVEDKQAILEEQDIKMRLVKTLSILSREIDIWSLEQKLYNVVRRQMDKNQREYFLREQMKAIQNELGEGEAVSSEAAELEEQIENAHLPEAVYEKCKKEVKRYKKLPSAVQEGAVIKSWLEAVLELPWNVRTKETNDLALAAQILDRDHYGLEKVKERIVEYLAVRQLTDGAKGSILCLVGPPGVGKTSIARSVAEATGRNYVRMSLGGIRDEAEIRGHRKTYVGSMPGRIMNAMRQAGSKNPLLLLDEIDKMSNDFKGDPAAALLEVLDAEQNVAFRDHYLEVPFDLSSVLFITTANTLDTIPRPLLDRMEIIQISSYTAEEKEHIAAQHLIPKQIQRHGLKKANVKIDRAAVQKIISDYTKEAGVRGLERQIATICRKAAKAIVTGEKKTVSVTQNNLAKFLGNKTYRYEAKRDRDEVGVAVGLAWTQAGGDTLFIEANVMDGTGKIELTGSLGDVMKESAKAAISCIRSRAAQYKIPCEFYKDKDIHIHVPEGATPKDGPSAGITIATAVISALTGRSIKKEVAMTGEITLRGRVLPIGGLKEKSIAAYRMGATTVVIPKENQRDLEDVPDLVKEQIRFVAVETIDQVLQEALNQ